MNRITVAQELVKLAKGLVAEDSDPMADEKLSSLFVKFHTWATKKGTSLPPGAPVVTQILDGMAKVEKKLQNKMHLRGQEAVKALIDAMKDDFTMDAAPIPMLSRKYGQEEIRKMFHGW
jgi:hypothetical protein